MRVRLTVLLRQSKWSFYHKDAVPPFQIKNIFFERVKLGTAWISQSWLLSVCMLCQPFKLGGYWIIFNGWAALYGWSVLVLMTLIIQHLNFRHFKTIQCLPKSSSLTKNTRYLKTGLSRANVKLLATTMLLTYSQNHSIRIQASTLYKEACYPS